MGLDGEQRGRIGAGAVWLLLLLLAPGCSSAPPLQDAQAPNPYLGVFESLSRPHLLYFSDLTRWRPLDFDGEHFLVSDGRNLLMFRPEERQVEPLSGEGTYVVGARLGPHGLIVSHERESLVRGAATYFRVLDPSGNELFRVLLPERGLTTWRLDHDGIHAILSSPALGGTAEAHWSLAGQLLKQSQLSPNVAHEGDIFGWSGAGKGVHLVARKGQLFTRGVDKPSRLEGWAPSCPEANPRCTEGAVIGETLFVADVHTLFTYDLLSGERISRSPVPQGAVAHSEESAFVWFDGRGCSAEPPASDFECGHRDDLELPVTSRALRDVVRDAMGAGYTTRPPPYRSDVSMVTLEKGTLVFGAKQMWFWPREGRPQTVPYAKPRGYSVVPGADDVFVEVSRGGLVWFTLGLDQKVRSLVRHRPPHFPRRIWPLGDGLELVVTGIGAQPQRAHLLHRASPSAPVSEVAEVEAFPPGGVPTLWMPSSDEVVLIRTKRRGRRNDITFKRFALPGLELVEEETVVVPFGLAYLSTSPQDPRRVMIYGRHHWGVYTPFGETRSVQTHAIPAPLQLRKAQLLPGGRAVFVTSHARLASAQQVSLLSFTKDGKLRGHWRHPAHTLVQLGIAGQYIEWLEASGRLTRVKPGGGYEQAYLHPRLPDAFVSVDSDGVRAEGVGGTVPRRKGPAPYFDPESIFTVSETPQ